MNGYPLQAIGRTAERSSDHQPQEFDNARLLAEMASWPSVAEALRDEARHRFRFGGDDGLVDAGMFQSREGAWYRPDSAVACHVVRQLLADHAGVMHRDGHGRDWAVRVAQPGRDDCRFLGIHLGLRFQLGREAEISPGLMPATSIVKQATFWETVRAFELLLYLAEHEDTLWGTTITVTATELITALWSAPEASVQGLRPLLGDAITQASRIVLGDFVLPADRWRMVTICESPACWSHTRHDGQLEFGLSPLIAPVFAAFASI